MDINAQRHTELETAYRNVFAIIIKHSSSRGDILSDISLAIKNIDGMIELVINNKGLGDDKDYAAFSSLTAISNEFEEIIKAVDVAPFELA